MSVLSGFGYTLYPHVLTFSCWIVYSSSIYPLCWLFKGKESSPMSHLYLVLSPTRLTWAMAHIWVLFEKSAILEWQWCNLIIVAHMFSVWYMRQDVVAQEQMRYMNPLLLVEELIWVPVTATWSTFALCQLQQAVRSNVQKLCHVVISKCHIRVLTH